MSKIQFWKQFTTLNIIRKYTAKLYSICQRYNFESNLQHCYPDVKVTLCCIRYVKDTILKAIYNYIPFDRYCKVLYSICQRYNFESNLQHILKELKTIRSCIRYVKDTILKAIYNIKPFWTGETLAVFDMSKIQFWKQFTTFYNGSFIGAMLYSICQRYNFESNLQRAIQDESTATSCIRYVKDTILKAIYNLYSVAFCNWGAVFDMSKIQFWKQFTTSMRIFTNNI